MVPKRAFGRTCARARQDRDQEDGGKGSVICMGGSFRFIAVVPGLGTRTSEVNQMRRRWPARIVIVGSRFRNRSRIEVALWPSPWPTPERSP